MKWNTKINLDKHNVWFTADLHLFHSNILWMNNRPFSSCDEMYNYILNEWNSKVKDNDYVFILGDVLWGSQESRLKALSEHLNGNICIVLGNHDKERNSNQIEGGNFRFFNSVARADLIKCVSEKNGTNQDIFMSHYPCISWPGKGRGTIHLHGHVHGNLDEFNEKSTDLRLDVGLDAKFSHMKLVSFDDIYEYMIHKAGDIPLTTYMSNLYNKDKNVII